MRDLPFLRTFIRILLGLCLGVGAVADVADGDYGGPGLGGVYTKNSAGQETGPEVAQLRVFNGVPYSVFEDGSLGFPIGSYLGEVINLTEAEYPLFLLGPAYAGVAPNGHLTATNVAPGFTYRLDLIPPATMPQVTAQPTDVTPQLNGPVSLFINSAGGAPLRYQWMLNDQPVAGETRYRLDIANIQPNQLGSYVCVISNPQGSVTSSVARVKLNVPAPVVTLPATFPLTLGANTSFGATVTDGQPPFTYQWYKSGELLPGKTEFSIGFFPAAFTDAGTYYVVVNDGFGNSVPSNPCQVTVPLPDAPLVFGSPQSATVEAGAAVTFRARFYSQPPNVLPSVQWRRNGVPIAGGTVLSDQGQFAAVLTLELVQLADAGSYDCVASNAGGTSLPTQAAVLVVKGNDSPDRVDLSFNAGGAFEQAFNNPSSQGSIEGIAVQPDNKIIVVGSFQKWNGQARTNIVRLNEDGSVDTTFAAHHFTTTANGEISVPGVAVAPDGKIYVTGNWGTMDGGNTTPLVRLNANGTLDATFQPGAVAPGSLLLVKPDGTLLNNGVSLVNNAIQYLLQYPAGGAFNAAFGKGFTAARFSGSGASGWFANPDGTVVVGGGFGSVDAAGFAQFNLTKLNADGSLAPSFHTFLDSGDLVNHLARLSDGRFVATGDFQSAPKNVRRFLASGVVDTSFNCPVDGAAFAPVLVDLDTVYVPANTGNTLARLRADGSVDDSYLVKANDDIKFTAVDSRGRLIIAGWFTQVTGSMDDPAHTVARKGIARLNGRGTTTPPVTEVTLGNLNVTPGGGLGFSLATQVGITYVLETKTSLNDPNWSVSQTIVGDGTTRSLEAALAGLKGFFRVRTQ